MRPDAGWIHLLQQQQSKKIFSNMEPRPKFLFQWYTYLSAIRSTMVSVGISRLITKSTCTTCSKWFACPTVLGKPSRRSDLPSSRLGVASSITKAIINSSGTSFPSFIYVFACFPSRVSSRTCFRRRSPVERW